MNESKDDIMKILANEQKLQDKSDEKQVDLNNDLYKKLYYEFQNSQLERFKEGNAGIKQDRKQRKIFSYVIFAFMCLYMAVSLIIVFLCGKFVLFLSDGVLIALLTTTLANVIGIFNFVAKYLFNPK